MLRVMRNTMGKRVIVLDGSSLEIRDVFDVGYSGAEVKIAESALEAMSASRSVVMRILESDEVVYGINTGFGAYPGSPLSMTSWKSCSITSFAAMPVGLVKGWIRNMS